MRLPLLGTWHTIPVQLVVVVQLYPGALTAGQLLVATEQPGGREGGRREGGGREGGKEGGKGGREGKRDGRRKGREGE